MPRGNQLLVLVLAVFLASIARGGIEPIVTTDLLKVRNVSSVDLSSDGQKAVFSVRSIATLPAKDDGQPTYEYRTHLYFLNILDINARPVQLTHGKRQDSSPMISPDGSRVAFVRADADDETSQIWVLPLQGGEARQVTSFEHGASNPVWSPDGSALLVTSAIPMSKLEGSPPWPMERPERSWSDVELGEEQNARPDGTKEEIRAWLAGNAEEFNPHVINRIAFQGEHALREEMQFAHLFVIDPDDAETTPLQLTNGFSSHSSPAFLPDGQSIVYAATKSPVTHPDRLLEAGLWKVNIDGTDDQEILRLEGWTLRSPKPSQDGTVVAFVGRQTDEPADRQSQLGLISIVDPEAEVLWLTDEKTYDYSVSAFAWSGPNIELLFTGPREGGFPLMMVNEGLVQPAPLVERNDIGPVGVQVFDVAGSTTIYSLVSAANPCVLRVIDPRGDRLVFDLNEWVADKTLSLPTGDWLTRPDGIKVQYWTMEPTNRESGQTYPVCLELHGGPSAMWGPGEFTMWLEFQLLCSWGYGVVYSNPRGSGGYGYTHQRANFQDWGDGPTGDVLAALDTMLENDWADPERLVVTGGSYAGYLTAYIVGHDHRFKAAVAQRGVYDIQTFFGEGNAWRLARWAMGGYPWETRMRAIYRRESPFTDVHRIRTPLLIMHSSNDLRTGVSQSEMLYRALKELEKPVEYIRYPGAGHDLSRTGDPKQRLDRLNRIIEFFERHIDNPRPAPQESSTADGR